MVHGLYNNSTQIKVNKHCLPMISDCGDQLVLVMLGISAFSYLCHDVIVYPSKNKVEWIANVKKVGVGSS